MNSHGPHRRTALYLALAAGVALTTLPARPAAAQVTVSSDTPTQLTIPIPPDRTFPRNTLRPGDVVLIQATLSTTDPNENGEGEPLIIRVEDFSGSHAFVQDTPISTFNSPQLVQVPIQTGGEQFFAYIQDTDGDETGTVTVSVNPRTVISPASKINAAQWGNNLSTLSSALGDAAAFCAGAPPTVATLPCQAAAVAGPLLSAAGFVLNQIASDPSDPNFTQIAQPTPPTPPALTAPPGTPAASVQSANALLATAGQVFALGQAIVTSINRAQGAADAGNTSWADKQQQAANAYYNQLQPLVSALSGLVGDELAHLRSAGLSATPNDILNAEQDIASNGLPADFVQALVNLGLSPAAIEQIRLVALTQNTSAVSANVNGTAPISAKLSITGSAGGTVASGQCLTLSLAITLGTGAVMDVTNDPNTFFVTDPPQGAFSSKNVFCPTLADITGPFTIHGIYHSPSGPTVQDTATLSAAAPPSFVLPRDAHPVITALGTDHGPLQARIIIHGQGFADFQGSSYVLVGSRQVPILSWSQQAITILMDPTVYRQGPLPLDTAYPIQVVAPDANTRSNTISFLLTSAPPPLYGPPSVQ